MLALENRRVVFYGGGRETAEKVRGLEEAGARVDLLARGYREGDLEGAWLVFAHRPGNEGHAEIFAAAERGGVWCNAVDDKPHCAFTMPAVHRQGDLTIAISTNGVAPALAARLRAKFQREVGPEYAAFLEYARALRPTLTHATFEERRAAWYAIVDAFFERLRNKPETLLPGPTR